MNVFSSGFFGGYEPPERPPFQDGMVPLFVTAVAIVGTIIMLVLVFLSAAWR